MWIATNKDELRAQLRHKPAPVLVPTMGALHRGHISLIAAARAWAGPERPVVVSIFVNPTQFDRSEDFEHYPRPLADDLETCRQAQVDGVFAPSAQAMYASDHSILVSEQSLSQHLCGASRPGHFAGVCTVVLKLFALSSCAAAVFGEKDFQQLAIIRRLVRDLDLPIEIIAVPTVREADGLALSSRNVRLAPSERADALRIYRALCHAATLPPDERVAAATRLIANPALNRIDYLEQVDALNLQPARGDEPEVILAAAVWYGQVRLIDHVRISQKPPLS